MVHNHFTHKTNGIAYNSYFGLQHPVLRVQIPPRRPKALRVFLKMAVTALCGVDEKPTTVVYIGG